MFITFEGVEGSGKSTQIARVEAYVRSKGRDVLHTREPGGSLLGMSLRRILLDVKNKDLTAPAELFLMLADRAQHVAQVIRPALDAGKVVLCDRYADSTAAYQGYGRGLEPKMLQMLNEMAVAGLWPDKTILLDLDPELGLKRAFARNVEEHKAEREGRFEAEELEFHRRVREGYLTLAALHKERFHVVEAHGDVETTFNGVKSALDRLSW